VPEIEDLFLPCWHAWVEHPTAVDVGAHVGNFSSALIESGFETWALEPNPLIFPRLTRRFQGEAIFHALNLAASSRRAILHLRSVEYDADAPDRLERNTLFSSLRKHPVFEGLRFAGSQAVVAWPLADLARARLIPNNIGILKIDAEGHDPDVLRGLGGLRPDIVIVEFWNREFVFNRDQTANDIDTYVALLEPLGYNWSMTIFRDPETEKVGYSLARTQTPARTWGNIAFFRSEAVLEATLDWCAGVIRDGQAGKGGVMLSELASRSSIWRARLSRTARWVRSAPSLVKHLAGPGAAHKIARTLLREKVDVVVSPNEISSLHGTGVLLTRLLEARTDIVGIRSQTTYDGRQDLQFKDTFVLEAVWMDRAEVTEQVASWMRSYTVRSILCVPYYESDLLIALALKAISGAPMSLYIMDDNCLRSSGISPQVMAETVARADACFAISPELRSAYEAEFRRKFWILPPLVASNVIRATSSPVPEGLASKRDSLLIGNIWSQAWLDRLERLLIETDWRLTWLTSNTRPAWLNLPGDGEAASRVHVAPAPPQQALIDRITNAPFIVVPSGSPEDGGSEGAIAKFSLPTRIPFVVATAGTPLLVIGSEEAAAARFVKRFDLGEAVPYDKVAFIGAVERLRSPNRQADIRERSALLAPKFDVAHAYEYLTSAARRGGYIPRPRFEPLFPPVAGEFSIYQEAPIPGDIYYGFSEVYRSMERLSAHGYRPDFVIDVGSSTGVWSYYISNLFPDAKFLLVDPLLSRYPKQWLRPSFLVEEVALGEAPGRQTLYISGDLYNSSLLKVNGVATEKERIDIQVDTVDRLVHKHGIKGRGVLKIDAQFAEHLVLGGAQKVLANQVDFLVAELTLEPDHADAKDFTEMIVLIDKLGFRLFDDAGGWRFPDSGFLDQKDFVFVRKGWAINSV
jgi:FkbM family methyltransferase